MPKLVLLAVLICSLPGVPALCMAGTLVHECECDTAINCAHEDDCADDPCGDSLGLPNSTASEDGAPSLAPALDPPLETPRAARPGQEIRTRDNLPFPPGQLPLLR